MSNCVPVGGYAPFSTIDWPGMLSAVVFLRGCPWRCLYCHNPELQRVAGQTQAWPEVEAFLAGRRGLLDGVVFSGGEPTMHADLPDALERVRGLGFKTGLHTGGAYPARLDQILSARLVDWVGFDVKAPFADYPALTGREDSGARARLALDHLVASGVSYELRTTIFPPLLSAGSIDNLAADIDELGGGNLVLQHCRGDDQQPLAQAPDLAGLAAELAPRLGRVMVR